jgi:putative ABC transport system substrate-binding protein
MPRLGYLSPGPREGRADVVNAFVEGLRDLGYVEGQTIAIEWRFAPAGSEAFTSAAGRDAAWAELATELVRLPVDVIVSLSSTPASLAAKAATNTIPIVVLAANPVETGLVASLSHPGGNVTGPIGIVGVNTKHLELLRSVVPGLTRAAAFGDTTQPASAPQWDEFRRAAETAGVESQMVDLSSTDDLEHAFDLVESGGAQALSVISTALLLPVRERVAKLALKHRLPAIARGDGYAQAGLLMTYGANTLWGPRRAAVYVDRILRGAKPADLPVEQPTVFDFVVNLKTAQALGLTIPPDVAAQVTKWIQ